MTLNLSELLRGQTSRSARIDRPGHATCSPHHGRLWLQPAIDASRILRDVSGKVVVLEDCRVRMLEDEVPLGFADQLCFD